MSKYIDVEKVQRLIAKTGGRHSRNGEDIQTCASVCADLIISVYQLPPADVQEVKHGRWKGAGMGDYNCSLCGHLQSGKTHYCPNCGAKMQGGDAE